MDYKYPLGGLCQQWRELIQKAKDQRHEEFGKYAEETGKFFDSAHNWMWKEEYARSDEGYLRKDGNSRLPSFMVTVNKISDAVDLYGPSLMQRYPQVMVSPNYPPEINPESLDLDIEMDQQSAMMWQQIQDSRDDVRATRDTNATISQAYLNWLQVEGKKKTHARRSITDAIVSGVGVLYHELYWPRGGSIKYPRSRFIRWKQLIKDPDAETPEDVQWIAVEWCVPVNIAERKFPSAEGLKGSIQSAQSQASSSGRTAARNKGKRSDSWDLITYWEIYSKNGFGARLKDSKDIPPEIKGLVEQWGDFCYIVVANNIQWPLNMPTEAIATESEEEIFERAHWPIPFYSDSGCGDDWPITELYFKENPAGKWPISIFKPLIGEIRFLNWVMSFLADKAAQSSTEYLGVLKTAADDIQEQLASQRGPFQLIKLDSTMGKRIDELISFLGKPTFDESLWKMASEVMDIIEKGSGVTELLYGQTSRQMRSAEEASVLQGNATIRPDDMAAKTDDWYSLAAKKEWQAAVWLLNSEDVINVLGPAGAWVFENKIQTEEFTTVSGDYHYRLVAGSARKPNKQQREQSLIKMAQVMQPIWQQLMQMGVPDPYNAFMEEYAKSLEIEDYERFVVDTEVLRQIIEQQKQEAQQAQQQQVEDDMARERQQLEMDATKSQQQMASDAAKGQQQLQFKGAEWSQKLKGQDAMTRLKLLEQMLSNSGSNAA